MSQNVRKRQKRPLKNRKLKPDFMTLIQKPESFDGPPDPEDVSKQSTWPIVCQRKPWESAEEYQKYLAFQFCPHPRSIRKAYRGYCKADGVEPKKDPPSNWYQLAKGRTLLVRKTEQREAAIDYAEKKHNRLVNWDAIEGIVLMSIEDGELDQAIYRGPFGEEITTMKIIEVAFYSLAIDLKGNPLPGEKTWEEIFAARHPQI